MDEREMRRAKRIDDLVENKSGDQGKTVDSIRETILN